MSLFDKIGAGALLTYMFVSSGVAPVSVLVAMVARENAEDLERLVNHHQTHHEYFFQGANTRGLLDICEREGSVGIYFKEDCEDRP